MEALSLNDVLQSSRTRGIHVDPMVAKYVAALLTVEADRGNKLTQQVIDTITYRTNGFMDVVELQVGMEQAFQQQRQLVDQEQQEQAAQVQALQEDLLDANASQYRGFKDYQRLHDAILQHVCLASPALAAAFTDEEAAQQVRAALASVFPVASAAIFVTATTEERVQQLEELARATLGICCLHQATGSSSQMMPAGLDACCSRGHRLLAQLEEQALKAACQLVVAAELLVCLPSGQPQQDALLELLHSRQVQVYRQLLAADLRSCLGAVQLLQQEEQRIIEEVLQVIAGSEAVPREQVLPRFVSLGATRAAVTEEVRLLVVHQRLADRLAELSQAAVPLLLKSALGATAAAQPMPPQPQLTPSEALQLQQPLPEGWSYATADELGQGPALALNGLCPVSLAGYAEGSSSTQGSAAIPVLQQSCPQLGYIRAADGTLYGCGTPASMLSFAKNPAAGLAAVKRQVLRYPLLMHLLGMQHIAPQCNLHAMLMGPGQPMMVEFGTQTPTHFIEKHIDRNYEWNGWVLRRRALALTELKNKRTHSTQTADSHFRREAQTQVWRPKEAVQQTPTQQGSTMPRKLRFVGGMQGPHDRKLRVLNLDLDLGQPSAGAGPPPPCKWDSRT